MDAPGKGMLMVVSILFIVFGAIALIVVLAGSALLFGVGFVGFAAIAAILGLIGSALNIVLGIIGIKKCGDPSQAMYFIVAGIVLCALQLISMVGSFSFMSLIGFVLPILYIVGGYMNRNAVARN